ncbi:MAG: hypothetical protein ABIM54_00875 [candidate division WOR-3 bacterium]
MPEKEITPPKKLPKGYFALGSYVFNEWKWRTAWNTALVALSIPFIADYFRKPSKEETIIGRVALHFLKRVMIPYETTKTAFASLTKVIETPELPEAEIRKLFTTLITGGISALVGMTVTGMIASSLGRLRLGYLAGIFYRLSGYRHITEAFLGNAFRYGLSLPLSYYFRYQYKTVLPPLWYMSRVYMRRAISTVTEGGWGWEKDLSELAETSTDYTIFRNYLELQGFPKKFIDPIIYISRRPLDPFSFAFLSQTGYFRGDEWKEIAKDMGYRNAVIEFLIKAPMMWGLSPFKTAIRTRIMNGVSDGFIEEEKAVRILENLWAILDMKAIMRIESQVRYWYETTSDKVKSAIDKFVKEIYSEEELIRDLTIGPSIRIEAEEPGVTRVSENLEMRVVNPDKLNYYLDLARTKAAKRTKRESTPDFRKRVFSTLSDSYSEGYLTLDNLKNELDKAEGIKELDSAMIYQAELEKWLSLNKEKVRVLEEKFYKDEINRTEFISEASKYIKDYSLLLDIADLIELKKKRKGREGLLSERQRVIRDDLELAFRKGKIDEIRFKNELEKVEQIKDPIALYLYQVSFRKWLDEEVKKDNEEKERLRENLRLLAGVLIDFYEGGYMSFETFSTEMEKIKNIQSLEAAYLMKGEYSLVLNFIKLTERLLVEKFQQGKIEEATFINELASLGVQEWKINYWLEEIEIRNYGRRLTDFERVEDSRYKLLKLLIELRELGWIDSLSWQYYNKTAKEETDPRVLRKMLREWQLFYDERKIKLARWNDLLKRKLITEADYYEKLKSIFAVREKLDEYFNFVLASIKK